MSLDHKIRFIAGTFVLGSLALGWRVYGSANLASTQDYDFH